MDVRIKPRTLSTRTAKTVGDLCLRWRQRKYDGWRLTLFSGVDKKGEYAAYSRQITPEHDLSTKLEYLPWFQHFCQGGWDYGTILDGELIYPGRNASYIPTALKQQDPYLQYVIFGTPLIGMNDCTRTPMNKLKETLLMQGLPVGVSFADFDELNPVDWWHRPIQALIDDSLHHARSRGWEGVVVKREVWGGWWKIKLDASDDLIVMGWRRGIGKFFGKMGALTLGYLDDTGRLVECATCSGMDDATRDAFNPKEDIGRVVEVTHNGVTEHGRLRHPRFIRWRDDKDPSECTRGSLSAFSS